MASEPGFQPTGPVQLPKTAELVANYLRRQVVTGRLSEGDALPTESALMQELNVSRPTLREAYRILESEGLISIKRGARGGARVQVPSVQVAARYAGFVLQHRGVRLEDVLYARMVVEAPAARALADSDDREALADKLEDRLASLQPGTAATFHDFNALVVELAGNDTLLVLAAMLDAISLVAGLRFDLGSSAEERASTAQTAHRARQRLIELVRAGDADGAERVWKAHLTAAARVLVEGIGAETVVDLFD